MGKESFFTTERIALIDATAFWSKATITSDSDRCWNWMRWTDKDGYGGVKMFGKSLRATRVAYALANGSFDEGLLICHSCDNPSCVNPKHLFLGTAKENHSDMVEKGRKKWLSGTALNHATLNDEKVIEIIRLYDTGEYTQASLAEMFGVAPSQIGGVVRGDSWKHIPRPKASFEDRRHFWSSHHAERKLTDAQIHEIRRLYSDFTREQLAVRFGCGESLISAALDGNIYGKSLPKLRKRLAVADVEHIRASKASAAKLAERYSVTTGTIYHIRCGRTWSN